MAGRLRGCKAPCDAGRGTALPPPRASTGAHSRAPQSRPCLPRTAQTWLCFGVSGPTGKEAELVSWAAGQLLGCLGSGGAPWCATRAVVRAGVGEVSRGPARRQSLAGHPTALRPSAPVVMGVPRVPPGGEGCVGEPGCRAVGSVLLDCSERPPWRWPAPPTGDHSRAAVPTVAFPRGEAWPWPCCGRSVPCQRGVPPGPEGGWLCCCLHAPWSMCLAPMQGICLVPAGV